MYKFFEGLSVYDLVDKGKAPLRTVKASDGLDRALEALDGIMSAPAKDAAGKYVGVFDVQSVAEFIASKAADAPSKSLVDLDFSSTTCSDVYGEK